MCMDMHDNGSNMCKKNANIRNCYLMASNNWNQWKQLNVAAVLTLPCCKDSPKFILRYSLFTTTSSRWIWYSCIFFNLVMWVTNSPRRELFEYMRKDAGVWLTPVRTEIPPVDLVARNCRTFYLPSLSAFIFCRSKYFLGHSSQFEVMEIEIATPDDIRCSS